MRVPPVEGRRRSFGLRGWLIVAAVVLVVLLLSLRGLARFYTDYLWFKDVGFSHTWRALLSAKVVPALIFSAVFFVSMLVNLIVADRLAPRYRGTGPEDEIIERYRGYVAPYAGPRPRRSSSLFFAIVMGSGVSAQWQNWILFSNSTDVRDQGPAVPQGHLLLRLPAAVPAVRRGLDLRGAARGADRLGGLPLPQRRHPAAEPVPAGDAAGEGAPLGAPRADGAHQDVQYYLAQFALTLSHGTASSTARPTPT